MRCLNPVTIKSPAKDAPAGAVMQVPCGKCENCLSNRRAMWSYRLQSMQRDCKQSFFVTLTYDDANRLFFNYATYENDEAMNFDSPLDFKRGRDFLLHDASDDDWWNDNDTFVPTVHPIEMSRFFKRFRKYFPGKIKYYCIGEYGGQFQRNHYHFALFVDYDCRQSLIEECILKAWTFGSIDVQYLCDQNINYITKYMMKGGEETAPEHAHPTFRQYVSQSW